MPFPTFPLSRPRRLRATPALRALVRETQLSPRDFVWPLFFHADLTEPRPISTMPGVSQLPVASAARIARDAVAHGLGAVILFGLPSKKDARGSSGLDPNGPVPKAIAAMKDAAPDLVVMTDVCVDEYTDHGHCGVLRKRRDGEMEVDNDATIEILAEMAVVHAKAGADVVAPSDMMDGRVARIRRALDESGFGDLSILSYAVKYASGFYGPFREAADCLDVIHAVRQDSTLPLFAYNVSGEYAMLKAAAAAGMIDYQRAMMEVLTSIRRAGADSILTYHAIEAAEVLGA